MHIAHHVNRSAYMHSNKIMKLWKVEVQNVINNLSSCPNFVTRDIVLKVGGVVASLLQMQTYEMIDFTL